MKACAAGEVPGRAGGWRPAPRATVWFKCGNWRSSPWSIPRGCGGGCGHPAAISLNRRWSGTYCS